MPTAPLRPAPANVAGAPGPAARHAALLAAVRAGDVARVRTLLADDPTCGTARTANGISIIMLAQRMGRPEIVRALLDCHPLLDIFEASAAGQAGRVSELLDRDAGLVRAISAEGLMPLHYAAQFGHVGVVRRLLRHGADPMGSTRNASELQPLDCALAGGFRAVEQLLRAHGAADNPRRRGRRSRARHPT